MNIIEEQYEQIEDRKLRKELVRICSREFGVKELSIVNHWFGRYYSVPDKYQDRVLQLIRNIRKIELKRAKG